MKQADLLNRLGSGVPWAALVAVLLLAGCAGAIEKVPVSGAITYDGEPVATGQIVFQSKAGGRTEVSIINEGKYSIPEQYGLTPGEYVVKITGDRPTGETAKTDSFVTADVSREIQEQFIPAKYNAASQLSVTIEPVAQATHDFSLSSR